MVEVFKYVDKFFASLTNYLTYNMIFIIFLGLFLFTVFCVIILTSHSYEAKLIKAIDKFNSYFIDNPQINEENLVSFNAKMKGKNVPKQLRKNWQQFVLYREAKASAYMSFENCVSNPIKNSTYKRDLKLMNKLAWILSMCALILNCYYCFESTNIAEALSSILLTPIIILLVNYIVQIFLTLKHSAIVSDLFQNYQYFEVNIDKATETLPEYVDYEVLFDRNEIKKGIPILYTYLQKRAEEEQRELERARLRNVEHEKFNFDDQGVAASLVLERAMQEAENYIAERKKYNQDIGQINSDMTQEDMNYREITKEYNRQMQVSKETFANFKSQLEEVTSTIEANYLKKQQQQELDRQRNLERDFDTATEKHKKVIESFHIELDTVDKFIAQSRKNLEDAMKSEFSTYSSKVYDEAKKIAEQRVKDKLEKSKSNIIELEEKLVIKEQELKEVYEENIAIKEEMERLIDENSSLREAPVNIKKHKRGKNEEDVYVPQMQAINEDEEPEDSGMIKTYEEEQPEAQYNTNFTQAEEQDFESGNEEYSLENVVDEAYNENEFDQSFDNYLDDSIEENTYDGGETIEEAAEGTANELDFEDNSSENTEEDYYDFDVENEFGDDLNINENTDEFEEFNINESVDEFSDENANIDDESAVFNETEKDLETLDVNEENFTTQTDDSIEQPKSKRGRPKKIVDQVVTGEKKKVGRPRKEKSETSNEGEKRGRGRPKKEVATKEEKAPVKKGRGRPKKEVAKTEIAKVPTKKDRGRPKKEVATKEEKAPVKKGRGRPKKEVAKTEIAKAPTKKGRGRPKKEVTTKEEKAPVKKGRGRPKKEVAKTEIAKAPIKKGRGRPKKNLLVEENKKPSKNVKVVDERVKSESKNIVDAAKEDKFANEIKDIDAYLKEIDDAIAAENAILEETQKELAKKAKLRNKK